MILCTIETPVERARKFVVFYLPVFTCKVVSRNFAPPPPPLRARFSLPVSVTFAACLPFREGGRLFRGVIDRLIGAGFHECKTDKKAFGVIARR